MGYGLLIGNICFREFLYFLYISIYEVRFSKIWSGDKFKRVVFFFFKILWFMIYVWIIDNFMMFFIRWRFVCFCWIKLVIFIGLFEVYLIFGICRLLEI